MFKLKLEQNLFYECSPEYIKEAAEEQKGDSVFRTLKMDPGAGAESITIERRKYPYFFKYYLYLNEDREHPVDFKTEEGIKILHAFYKKYRPEYLKISDYEEGTEKALSDYFYTEKVPGEAMQHFQAAGEEMEETDPLKQKEKEAEPAVSTMEGYHEFNVEEKEDIAGQMDALKSQYAEELAKLQALIKK